MFLLSLPPLRTANNFSYLTGNCCLISMLIFLTTLFLSSESLYANPNHEERRAALFNSYQFECSCRACANENFQSSFQSLPAFDPEFDYDKISGNKSIKDLVEELRRNCEYLKKNFKHYPSLETVNILSRNWEIVLLMGTSTNWPFA